MSKKRLHYLVSPAGLFLVTAVLLTIAGFFWNTRSTVDVQLHDTFFVIAGGHFFWGLSLLFILGGGIYIWLGGYMRWPLLSWGHVLITVFILVALGLRGGYIDGGLDWYRYRNYFSEYRLPGLTIKWWMPLLLLGQLLFGINLIGGLASRFKSGGRRKL